MRAPSSVAAAAICGAALVAGSIRVEACQAPVHLTYNEPIELEGVLKSGTGHHEAQGEFSFVYLALEQGICVDAPKGRGNDDLNESGTEQPVDRIQIAGDAIMSELPIGEPVMAKGSLFAAHTMWHVEPVLLDATSIELK